MKKLKIVQPIVLIIFFAVMLGFSSCRPMCPMDSCHVKFYHQHTELGMPKKWQKKISRKKKKGKEAVFYWRGSKWWKKQNARLGEKHRADARKRIPKKTIRKKKNNLKKQ